MTKRYQCVRAGCEGCLGDDCRYFKPHRHAEQPPPIYTQCPRGGPEGFTVILVRCVPVGTQKETEK